MSFPPMGKFTGECLRLVSSAPAGFSSLIQNTVCRVPPSRSWHSRRLCASLKFPGPSSSQLWDSFACSRVQNGATVVVCGAGEIHCRLQGRGSVVERVDSGRLAPAGPWWSPFYSRTLSRSICTMGWQLPQSLGRVGQDGEWGHIHQGVLFMLTSLGLYPCSLAPGDPEGEGLGRQSAKSPLLSPRGPPTL